MDSQNPYASPPDAPPPVQPKSANSELVSILFSFQGRIPRRVFWLASLGIVGVFYLILIGLVVIFGEESPVTLVGILLLYIPLIWTSFAVQVKRWHDRDKSGLWILISFIPLIGPLWALVETGFLRGTFGDNRFGPDPT